MLYGALIVLLSIVGIAIAAIVAFYVLKAVFFVLFMLGATIYNLFKY